MKTVIETELGTAYRLENGVLTFSPLSNDGSYDQDFYEVQEDLVGDETVNYQGKEMTLSQVFRVIEKKLGGNNAE